jgi:peptidoglycan/LPS O-acetylase OafA/YrhL
MALHVFKANSHTPSHAVNLIYALIHSGWVGVDLFFVLSGFLITRILYRTQFDPHYLRVFYARRALRIFPLYFGVIALLVVLEPLLHLHLWRALPYYLTYTANLRTAGPIYFHDVPGNAWIISHFWSLQVEEQFYLAWPLLLALLRTPRNIVLGALAGCGVAIGVRCYFVVHAAQFPNEYWPYAFTPCRIDSLLIGAALAICWHSRARSLLASIAPWMLGGCSLVLLVDGCYRREFHPTGDPFLMTIGYTLVALGGAALIVLVLSRELCRNMFERKTLCLLGKYSYGIYILHFIWNYFLSDQLRQAIFAVTHSKALAVGTTGLVVISISILNAYLSYEFFEKKMLRLKRHFVYSGAAGSEPGLRRRLFPGRSDLAWLRWRRSS